MTPIKFGLRKYLNSFVVISVLLFALCSFQQTDLSNPLLRSYDSFWFSLADNVTTGTYKFESLIVEIILLPLKLSLTLPLTLSAPAADKTKYFVNLSFNST